MTTVSSLSLYIPGLNADLLVELDMEYRYWCFIEGHPAHVPLAAEIQTEAMDALKWSYTGEQIQVAFVRT